MTLFELATSDAFIPALVVFLAVMVLIFAIARSKRNRTNDTPESGQEYMTGLVTEEGAHRGSIGFFFFCLVGVLLVVFVVAPLAEYIGLTAAAVLGFFGVMIGTYFIFIR